MRFPVSVLTTAAVSRSLVLVLTERYYYESDWNSFSNYTHLIGQGCDGFEVARRFRDAAVEDTEGVILDIQAVVGVSQVSFLEQMCVSLWGLTSFFSRWKRMNVFDGRRRILDGNVDEPCVHDFLPLFLFLLLAMLHHVSFWPSFVFRGKCIKVPVSAPTYSFDNRLTKTVVWLGILFFTVLFDTTIHSDCVYTGQCSSLCDTGNGIMLVNDYVGTLAVR